MRRAPARPRVPPAVPGPARRRARRRARRGARFGGCGQICTALGGMSARPLGGGGSPVPPGALQLSRVSRRCHLWRAELGPPLGAQRSPEGFCPACPALPRQQSCLPCAVPGGVGAGGAGRGLTAVRVAGSPGTFFAFSSELPAWARGWCQARSLLLCAVSQMFGGGCRVRV